MPEGLSKDVEEPWIAKELLVLDSRAYWHGTGTISPPHTDAKENFMCVVKGWKEFSIVSPFQRRLVYSGAYGHPVNYSPVNFN